MALYKLTDQHGKTYGDTLWGEGITHRASDGTPMMCTDTVIHVYRSPEEAALFNPAHAAFENPVLWECSDEEILLDDGLKLAVKQLTTLRQIPLPAFTAVELATFSIYCVPESFANSAWRSWAQGWLDGKDRSEEAARAAGEAEAACWWAAGSAAGSAAAWAAGVALAAVAWEVEALEAKVAASAALAASTAVAGQDFTTLIRRAVANEKKLRGLGV